MSGRVRVSVMETRVDAELQREFCSGQGTGPCPRFKKGDELVLKDGETLTACPEAWSSVSRYVRAGLAGMPLSGGRMKDDDVMVASCPNATRPVIFKIERIPEEPAKHKASDQPGLPPLFESPEPWSGSTAGDFVPELRFDRYWRLNYSFLDDGEKRLYESMETAIRRGFSSVKVDIPADNNRIMAIAKALIEDNWSLFYIDTGVTVTKDPEGVYVCFHYNRFKEDRGNWMKAMKDVARNVFELRVKDCRTRYDAEMAIHDYLTETVQYDKSDPELAHSPVGPLLYHKGVCEGISEAFSFLACACGLKAANASGILNKAPHRWNVVEIDDERYHLDVTSDLSGLHAYFNCSDGLLAKSHVLGRLMGCRSDMLNFYTVNGCRFRSGYNAKLYIENMSKKREAFEFMLDIGTMPQEVIRMARNGAGQAARITVTNIGYTHYRVMFP